MKTINSLTKRDAREIFTAVDSAMLYIMLGQVSVCKDDVSEALHRLNIARRHLSELMTELSNNF